MIIPNELLEQIKSIIPIEEVIQEKIALKRQGKTLVGAHHTHGSSSGTSFTVDPDRGLYHCFNCGEGGDLFTWGMKEYNISFIECVSMYARRAGVPLPEMTDEERERQNRLYNDRLEIAKVYKAAVEFYQEQLRPEHLDFCARKWGWTEETVQRFKIGFAPVGGDVLKNYLKGRGFDIDFLIKTGLFVKVGKKFKDFFQGRLVIPYLKNGEPVYFNARQTDETPDQPWEDQKYKKLLTHGEKHPYVSPAVQNAYFFGEDEILGQKEIYITEGMADCITALQLGLPCFSPGTVRFRREDHAKLLRLVRNAETVYIANDAEENGAGLKGALATAEVLDTGGVAVRIIELPRPRGVEKVDLAEFLKAQGLDAFRELQKKARNLWAIKLDQVQTTGDAVEDIRALQKFVTTELAGADELTARALIRGPLQDRFNLDKSEVKALLKKYERAAQQRVKKEKEKAVRERHRHMPPIKQALIDYEFACAIEERRPEMPEKARIVYNWFVQNGGQFFASETGESFLVYDNVFYQISNNRLFNALLFALSDLTPTDTEGRGIWEALQSLAFNLGRRVTHGGWFLTRRRERTIYINLQKGNVAKLSPGRVEIIPNGVNEDGVLLADDNSFVPIEYNPEADKGEALAALSDVLVQKLACDTAQSWFVTCWALTGFMMGFAGETLPPHKFSGESDKGKTTAARLISYLVYGQDLVGRGTDAANYSEGARVPILIEDNLEVRNMTQEKRDFILMAATGTRKRKRDVKTANGVIHERPQVLVLITGIEAFYDAEILNRTYDTRFDRDAYAVPGFLETEVCDNIVSKRNDILSGLFKIIADDILPNITERQRELKMQIEKRFPGWEKNRTNAYLATMGVLYNAFMRYLPDSDKVKGIILEWITVQSETQQEDAQETSEVVWFFEGLYQEWLAHKGENPFNDDAKDYFRTVYKLDLVDCGKNFCFEASSQGLFVAYSLLAKNFNKRTLYTNSRQLGQRISNDRKLLEGRGWEVPDLNSPSRVARGTRYYLWRKKFDDD